MSDIERYNYAFDPEGEDWAARLLRRLPPQGSVLELGPGPGAMTRVMVDRGYQVTVVENDPGAFESLRAMGVEVIDANLEEDEWIRQLQGRRFDAVLACDVLEHLRSPEHVLTALRNCMQPMGQLIISVPNVAYGGIVAGLINGVFDYTQTGLLDRTHIRFFSRRSLEKSLLELGWSPRAWESYRWPIERSEFAWCWDALTDAQRQGLVSACSEFDVYEWMAVASPSGDASAWAVKEAQAAAEKAREELQAMKLLYEQEHASLLEHQKAFSQARGIIESQQVEVKVMRSEVGKLQTAMNPLPPQPRPSLLRRARGWLRRKLGR